VGDSSLKNQFKNPSNEKKRRFNFLGGVFARNLQENGGLLVPSTIGPYIVLK
jgi:hypothetical protein